MKVISGTELLIDIRNRKYLPTQKFIRLTQQRDLVELDYNYDLVWCDNNFALKSHSISDFDFEVLEEEKKIELPEKIEIPKIEHKDNQRILNAEIKINSLIDYLKYKEEESKK
jgi:hypothetical protein